MLISFLNNIFGREFCLFNYSFINFGSVIQMPDPDLSTAPTIGSSFSMKTYSNFKKYYKE